ncbi:MAG: polysaccharide deacetylase family protein [Defluviitaleaceae bacterium]|nr:polysaccharide deacetylase family protein [Defluviitaleaceae bacterium]
MAIKYFFQALFAFSMAFTVLMSAPVILEKKAMQFISLQPVSAKTRKRNPIFSVDTDEKKAAITLNAAWGAEDTDALLKIMADNDVLATFFFCGSWVDRFPDELRKFAAAGHEIANHGDTHAHVSQLNLAQNKKEIMDCHHKIKAVTGIEPNLYRPPYGEYNDTVLAAAEQSNYYTIQWDVDSLDWKAVGRQYEIDRVLKSEKLKNGSIILFHNGAKYTPQTLDTVIKGLKAKGYELVRVSDLIYKENFEIDHSGRQKSAVPV